ncbi:MAG: hypothetical protein ACK47B_26910 [Armatimonadota bacterium]
MTQSVLRVEECCDWCRKPVQRCTESSCDDARTYSGILVRGEWKELDGQRREAILTLTD